MHMLVSHPPSSRGGIKTSGLQTGRQKLKDVSVSLRAVGSEAATNKFKHRLISRPVFFELEIINY